MLRKIGARAAILREFYAFLLAYKLWWMIPMFSILLLFGLMIVLTQGSPIAPFIYTLF